MRRAPLLSVLAALLLGTHAAAQDFDTMENEALKIRFKVHKKLQSIPIKLGDSNPHLKMRFEPRSAGDHIHGRLGTYEWYCNLLEFPKNLPDAKPADGEDEEGSGGTKAERMEAALRKNMAPDWQTWVTEKDPGIQDRTFVANCKGREVKAKGKTPAYTWWEYHDKMKTRGGEDLYWYTCAATYDFPDKQLTLLVTVPVMDKKGAKPEDKHYKWQTTMTQSVETIVVDEGEDLSTSTAKKEQFADTEQKKKELEKAKANIASLPGWDYYTTPNYIVLWSWNPDKPDRRPGNYKFARSLSTKLEQMRELYTRDYPPHDNMLQMYSILRICDDHEAFMKYGSTQFGVVGWFSPLSKELVVFDDRMRVYGGKQDVVATTMHEGWHQYAHSYYGEDVELHRWFDEGSGDFYGGYVKVGNTWKYTPDKGRVMSIKSQIARKNYIPTREIVTWNKDKFYGPRAPDHYAQGYSLIDFLRRGGEVLGKKFDPSWGKILETYRVTMLESKNQKTAVEKAFEGIDFDKLEEAWLEWVKKNM